MLSLTFPKGSALVAGGTGNVGAGVTRRLAEAGLSVTFTYIRNADRAEALAAELRGRGLAAWACHMDMRSPESIERAVVAAESNGGPLNTLACAAGPDVPVDLIADMDPAAAAAFVDADAVGQLRLVNKAVPALRRRGGGSITLCSTIAVDRSLAFDGLSSFSKAAVRALVRQLAWEEAANAIRCNAVSPSLVIAGDRAMLDVGIAAMAPPRARRIRALADQIDGLARLNGPVGPDAVGDLYAFLASNEARFITGQCVAIDGGATL